VLLNIRRHDPGDVLTSHERRQDILYTARAVSVDNANLLVKTV